MTKRLKVTQGISASPKVTLYPSRVTVIKNESSDISLTVVNTEELAAG